MPLQTVILRQVIRAHLMADPAVSGLVGGRVFGSHLSDSDVQSVEFPLTVFEFLSGFARWHRGVQSQSFELYGYSKASLDEAAQIYDAAFDSLQHCRVRIDAIADVGGIPRETQRPVDGWNDKVGAWFVRGRWIVTATG
jgi:hypothetical protein